MEPEGSVPRLQMTATCPCPKPDQSRPCPLPEDPSWYNPPIYAWVFQEVFFPHVSPPKLCMQLSLHPQRATRPAHIRQIFAYPDAAIGFIRIISLTSFMGIPYSMRMYKSYPS